MKFEKLNGRNRKTLVKTTCVLVLEKDKDTYDNFFKHCLCLWLGIERRYQRALLFCRVKNAKRSFFENNPKCKYAVLTGFDPNWAQEKNKV